jgi:hypothetical protein
MACRIMLQQDSKNTVASVENGELGDEAQKLIDRKRDDAEHEMQMTLAWPRTRTIRPPNSSLIRALTRSTVVRSL